jgi:hypothetical protein
MKKIILTLATFMAAFCTGNEANAQNGNVSLGMRATPDGGGFTAKFYASKAVAIETQLNAGGIFGGDGESFNLVGLAEYHIFMPDPSWQIYLGGGLHGGVWNRDGVRRWDGDSFYWDNDTDPIFGIDAIGGVEYKFKRIPLSLSADMKPAINFVPEPDAFWHNFVGISARFHIY